MSASYKDGYATITIANRSASEEVKLDINAVRAILSNQATITVLSNEDYHAHNTFEEPGKVAPQISSVSLDNGITIPAAGIVSIGAMVEKTK